MRCMINVFTDVYEYLKARNLQPQLRVLDNECCKAVRNYICINNSNIHLGELHNHQVYAKETVVKATKYHISAGLATIDNNCPLQMWDLFIPQTAGHPKFVVYIPAQPEEMCLPRVRRIFQFQSHPQFDPRNQST